MNLSADPDLETLKLMLIIAGSLLLLFLAIIGYFLNKQITLSERLTTAVQELTIAVSVLQDQNIQRLPVIDTRLNAHADRLDLHARQITRIETKLENDKKTG